MEKNEMGGACGMGEERCRWGFGGEIWGIVST